MSSNFKLIYVETYRKAQKQVLALYCTTVEQLSINSVTMAVRTVWWHIKQQVLFLTDHT